jgi:hypothetical protein
MQQCVDSRRLRLSSMADMNWTYRVIEKLRAYTVATDSKIDLLTGIAHSLMKMSPNE